GRRRDRPEDLVHHPSLLRPDRGHDQGRPGEERAHDARPWRGCRIMDEAFEIEAQALAQILDELDYFQILKIGQQASPADIKAAYYRESRAYHPDRFSTLAPGALKENIGRIYKRINEAYVCLRDDSKRTKYLGDVIGPDRQSKLRFIEASEQELKK